jgi:3-oxoacyl-[acyl-carrier protein] reductase
MSNILLFGITGNIGSKIAESFVKKGIKVIGVTRKNSSDKKVNNTKIVKWDVFKENPTKLEQFGPFNRVCWSQGENINDSIFDFDEKANLKLYQANCLYIMSSLAKLIKYNLLSSNAKLCVISSIWQNIARQNKLSYSVTKSALRGLINSLAIDLAKDGHLINAILPGPLNTDMTMNSLTKTQLKNFTEATFFNRFAEIKDVANMVHFLCSEDNTSINGQFINIDLGFSNGRII